MRRVRLRTLLLLINLLILILPLAGIWFLRLYESALIRQTESELIAQAATLGGAFKAERRRLLAAGLAPAEADNDTWRVERSPAAVITRAPGLDLADDPILPPSPDPAPAAQPPTALATRAGEALAPVLHDAQQVTLASIRVLDSHGLVVATTGNDLGLGFAALDEVARALRGDPISAMRWRERPARSEPGGISRGANLRVFVALPIVDDDRVVGAIMLSRTPRDLFQAIYGKRYPLMALALLLCGIGLLLAIVASRLITRPLDAVVAQARLVAAGEVENLAPQAASGIREAAELSAAVAQMAQTLSRRADYIRGFAAHVSHEFKTPLAGAKGAIELLEDHFATMSDAERHHFLGIAADGLDRLDRLVRRLVDLARAEIGRPDPAEATRLAPLLHRLAERYRDLGLAVTLDGADDISVQMPEEALDVMLSALLDNAVQHAGKGHADGGAAVTIAASAPSEQRAIVTLSDNGPGIPAAARDHIFAPFFTTARAAGGTGLGLPIARAIAAAAGGAVTLAESRRGAAFRLDLPRAIGPRGGAVARQRPMPAPVATEPVDE